MASTAPLLITLARYNMWANRLLLDGLSARSSEELHAPQPVAFGSLIRTAHHVLAMSEVWQAHLLGRPHGHADRNPPDCPPLDVIVARQPAIDDWLVDFCASEQDWAGIVAFDFIGGGAGTMRRDEIVAHVVNHASYHRGHIVAGLNALGHGLPASDLPVFLTLFQATSTGLSR